MEKVKSKIAKLITENAATHSKIIKTLECGRTTYYKKLKGELLFTDSELETIASISTIKIEALKKAVKKTLPV